MESSEYLSRQLITYIGNKRALLDFIGSGLRRVSERLGREKLDIFDVFSGSGVVARYFKRFSNRLVVNDIESYAEVANRCYLANASETDLRLLEDVQAALLDQLGPSGLREGFIHELYAPKDDLSIQPGERVFYTGRNARYLDTARQLIETLDPGIRPFFLAPLLSEASIHANTSGVFKGFHKGGPGLRGEFGGRKGDALSRIKGDIELRLPLFSNFDCEVSVHRGDAKEVAGRVGEVDLAYLDPPYNQHPYGSNYFMLNLIADYERPTDISRVSGIPRDWHRSDFNSARKARDALKGLLGAIQAKFLMVSFNSEGFIPPEEMQGTLAGLGRLETLETRYNTFKGSRNLSGRQIHVREYLYLVEKA